MLATTNVNQTSVDKVHLNNLTHYSRIDHGQTRRSPTPCKQTQAAQEQVIFFAVTELMLSGAGRTLVSRLML